MIMHRLEADRPDRGAALQVPAAAPATGVAGIGLTVSDLERSVGFYTALGFEQVAAYDAAGARLQRLYSLPAPTTRTVRLQLGGDTIELTEFRAPRGPRNAPLAHSNDQWFRHVAIVVRDIYEALHHIRHLGASGISAAPQRIPSWNGAAAGIRAYYFRDPDGHPLELIEFPAGKGRRDWQQAHGELFLGIDHTALVVDNTASSLAFYSGVLGLRISGGSVNYGMEQELLSGVAGAHVAITTLSAPRGPGIELLEYRSPRSRRRPPGMRVNDRVHVHTTLHTPDAALAEAVLRRIGCTFISKGLARVPGPCGYAPGLLVRDPDGHAVQIIDHEPTREQDHESDSRQTWRAELHSSRVGG